MSTHPDPTAAAAAPASHYQRIGGDAAIERLVEAFYRHMDSRPDARGIRAMHAPDLTAIRAVLVLYLREWMGGPRDYTARRGHPRLRHRHLPFAIGADERDAWLACMRAALADTGVEPALQGELMAAFAKVADWMHNTRGPAADQPHRTPIAPIVPVKESS